MAKICSGGPCGSVQCRPANTPHVIPAPRRPRIKRSRTGPAAKRVVPRNQGLIILQEGGE